MHNTGAWTRLSHWYQVGKCSRSSAHLWSLNCCSDWAEQVSRTFQPRTIQNVARHGRSNLHTQGRLWRQEECIFPPGTAYRRGSQGNLALKEFMISAYCLYLQFTVTSSTSGRGKGDRPPKLYYITLTKVNKINTESVTSWLSLSSRYW